MSEILVIVLFGLRVVSPQELCALVLNLMDVTHRQGHSPCLDTQVLASPNSSVAAPTRHNLQLTFMSGYNGDVLFHSSLQSDVHTLKWRNFV